MRQKKQISGATSSDCLVKTHCSCTTTHGKTKDYTDTVHRQMGIAGHMFVTITAHCVTLRSLGWVQIHSSSNFTLEKVTDLSYSLPKVVAPVSFENVIVHPFTTQPSINPITWVLCYLPFHTQEDISLEPLVQIANGNQCSVKPLRNDPALTQHPASTSKEPPESK